MIRKINLYEGTEPSSNRELFSTLHAAKTVRIESIRSWLKDPGEWYDQEEEEWVALLEGEATLEIAGEILFLQRGDSLLIPSHTLHRVLSTSPNALWIGVFY